MRNEFNNVEYEKIEILVNQSGQQIDFVHHTEVDHSCIVGLAQVISDELALPNSTIELLIDGQEVFPSGFESKLIYAGIEVAPDDRFITTVNRDINRTKITGKFTDGGAIHENFSAYTANIYLMVLTNKE